MLKYDLLFAIRNFRKQKLFTSINLFGLSISIAVTCLIMIYVQHELSFDRFNQNADQIFRVYDTNIMDGKTSDWTQTSTPLAAFLQNKFPEISKTVRIKKVSKGLMSYGENHFFEENLILADPDLFDVFTLPLISGNQGSVLRGPNSVVISQSAAEKYFGKLNPIGKTIQYNRQVDLTVSGIMKDVPENTHLRFSMVASMATAKSLYGDNFLKNQMNTTVYTYLLTHKGINKAQFALAVSQSTKKYYGGVDFGNTYHIQPLTSIHLYSAKGGEYQPNGDIRTVYIFSAIAFLILLVACINYINLSFSINNKRSVELGVRKVMGADTIRLVRLYTADIIVMAGVSLLVSILLIWLLLPWFSRLVGSELPLQLLGNSFLASLSFLFLSVVLVSGPLSGWLASRLQPINALNRMGINGQKRIGLHGGLVLFQFGISIVLIITTLLVYRQMDFIKNKNLGFSKDELMIIPVNDKKVRSKIQTFKQEILVNPGILSASATSDLPGGLKWVMSIKYDGQNHQSPETMTYLEVDKDFISTYGIQLKEGYLLGDTACPYSGQQYILNETAVQKLGWDKPLGKMFSCNKGKQGAVSGIIQDFNFKSLHENIEPLFLYVNEGGSNYLALKLTTQNIGNTISFVQRQWNKIVPDSPFEYYFYDSYYDQLYKKEIRFGQIILIFSCIAILIACLGIFGLAAFLSEKRTKEIGIRKVNGAKISEILAMLNKDFIKWVAFAFVIASPVGWFVMNKWLENFAYKTELSWWIFALSGLLALCVALLTVSLQSWKAATKNPVEALRYE